METPKETASDSDYTLLNPMPVSCLRSAFLNLVRESFR